MRAPSSRRWPERRARICWCRPTTSRTISSAGAGRRFLGRTVKAPPGPLEAIVPTLTRLGFTENVAGLYREMIAAFGAGLGFEGKGRAVRGKVALEDVLRAGLA